MAISKMNLTEVPTQRIGLFGVLYINKDEDMVVICTIPSAEEDAMFEGTILYFSLNPQTIGNTQRFNKNQFKKFYGQIILSNESPLQP